MPKKEKAPTHGPEYEEFGHNLTIARVELGLSQMDIANALHMNQSTYAGYETGTRKVPLSAIIKFSEFFKKSPDELIHGKKTHFSDNNFSIYDSEKELLIAYRKADTVAKEMVHRALNMPSETKRQYKKSN